MEKEIWLQLKDKNLEHIQLAQGHQQDDIPESTREKSFGHYFEEASHSE